MSVSQILSEKSHCERILNIVKSESKIIPLQIRIKGCEVFEVLGIHNVVKAGLSFWKKLKRFDS